LHAKNSYQGFGSEYETLLNAFDKDIASLKKRVGKDRVASTLWAMQRSRKDVADFLQSNLRRTDISMLELTPEFIKDFAAYLSTDRGLANSTIWQPSHLKEEGVSMEVVMRTKDSRDMKDVQGTRFTKDGLTFKASQLKRGMTFAKMDAIIRRNAEKAQRVKTNGRLQSTHYELPKQDATPEPQKHTESSISIPSLGSFDTNNPVYDPAEEEFRRRMQRKKKRSGPKL
jgi:hypothetical protein